MSDLPSYRSTLAATTLALLLAGCTATQAELGGLQPEASAAEAGSEAAAAADGAWQPLWWQTAGDPVLADLVERGLKANPSLVCDSLSLQARELQADAAARKLGSRIQRLFNASAKNADEAASQARAYRYADRRAHVAADIAVAYFEVRRLQEVFDLRAKMLAQFNDNAEIAGFRREAGLAPGLDTGLAGSLVSVTQSDLDASRERLEAAKRELARLTGMELEGLATALGDEGQVPDIAANVAGTTRLSVAHRADLLALENSLIADMTRQKVTQEDLDAVLSGDTETAPADSPAALAVAKYREAQRDAFAGMTRDREAVAAAAARQAKLEKSGRSARMTAKDARLAYRSGTGDFSTVYVAEAAALAVEEARIRARADLATASIRLWTAQGRGWSEADLAAPAPGVGVLPEVTVCE
ncbi:MULTISPECIES: TolC family protein [Novosphingobium]|uniref:TolC family protein n=1 Tax=Novosphingobium TaxID=165696 RepID=UPI001E4E7081|nr:MULTISPECIES: TolC family protein [Novosphingobium]